MKKYHLLSSLLLSAILILSCKKEMPSTTNKQNEVVQEKIADPSPIMEERGGGGSSSGLGVTDTIISNFNAADIAAGNYVWFNANLSVMAGMPSLINVDNQKVSFVSNGILYIVTIPRTTILFSATSTLTSGYDYTLGSWVIRVPFGYTGEIFFGGYAYPSPGLQGGINPVNWEATFSSDAPGVEVNWKWAAAVYTQFSQNYNDANIQVFNQNGYQPGAPLTYQPYVIGGARGGGAGNLTGSWSGTNHVVLP